MASSFSQRWRSEEGKALAAGVLERLTGGGAPVGLGLTMTESGLFDLRGLALPPARVERRGEAAGLYYEARGGQVNLSGATLNGLDLREAVLDDLWLTASRVSGCRFDGARWRDGRVWGCTFDRCSFERSDLRDTGVAPEHGGTRSLFRDCAFVRADLRGVTWPGAVFEDCRFEDCLLAKADFGGSIHRRTRFSGRLSEVAFRDVPWDFEHFEPNEMEDVDFRDAELYYVEFRNLALRRVRWPEHAANETFAHFPCVLKGTIDAYAHDDRPDARGVRAALQHQAERMHPEQHTGVVHRGEFYSLADETIALMRRIEQECAGRG